MNQFKIVHLATQKQIAGNIYLARSPLSRLKGLMFIKSMQGFDGLLLDPCNSIHTCFMRFPIDVVFLDKNKCIVKIFRHLKPWRVTRIYFKARQVLELMADNLPRDIKVGDQLEVICTN